MEVEVKVRVAFKINGPALEDAMAEYDELTVTGMLKEVIDKAVAVDDVEVEMVSGPNTLEEYDAQVQKNDAPAEGAGEDEDAEA